MLRKFCPRSLQPLLLCLMLLIGLSGCQGCDDESGSTTQVDNNDDLRDQMDISLPQTCKDSDGDGFSIGLGCDEGLTQDCNDSNPAISPLASEDCDDNIDNNCDGEGDAWCEVRADPGCGCSSRSGAAGGWLTVLLLGLVSRRRRSTAA